MNDRLGMNAPISRRDFLNGTLVAGAGLFLSGHAHLAMAAVDNWTGYGGVGDYARSNGDTYDNRFREHRPRRRHGSSQLHPRSGSRRTAAHRLTDGFAQSPRVKSGNFIGALPFATDISDSGKGALHVAAS